MHIKLLPWGECEISRKKLKIWWWAEVCLLSFCNSICFYAKRKSGNYKRLMLTNVGKQTFYVLGDMCSAICYEVELVWEGLLSGIHIAKSTAVDEAALNSRLPHFPQLKARKHMRHAHFTAWVGCSSFLFNIFAPFTDKISYLHCTFRTFSLLWTKCL